MRIADQDLGGGRVRHVFTMGGKSLKAGVELTRDEVLSIREANRNALMDAGYLEVWPAPKAVVADMPRHIVHRGGGAYDIIAGVKLNSEPLTKDEAEELVAVGA